MGRHSLRRRERHCSARPTLDTHAPGRWRRAQATRALEGRARTPRGSALWRRQLVPGWSIPAGLWRKTLTRNFLVTAPSRVRLIPDSLVPPRIASATCHMWQARATTGLYYRVSKLPVTRYEIPVRAVTARGYGHPCCSHAVGNPPKEGSPLLQALAVGNQHRCPQHATGPCIGQLRGHDPEQVGPPGRRRQGLPALAGPGRASSAAARSSGTTRSSTGSRIVHEPSALAASTAARPAGVMRPSASSRATRSRLVRAQTLPLRRGDHQSMPRSSSSER